MKKIITSGFSLQPSTKKVTFTLDSFDIRRLYSIVDVKKNKVIYSLGTPGFGYELLEENVLTLKFNTAEILTEDPIAVVYDVEETATSSDPSGVMVKGYDEKDNKILIGNSKIYFREDFSGDLSNWSVVKDANDWIVDDGNTDGSSFLSLRVLGSEYSMEAIPDNETPSLPIISNIISISSTGTKCTVETNEPHQLNNGDRVVVYDCSDSRLNIGPVQIAVNTPNVFSFIWSVPAGTYNITGKVKLLDPFAYSSNGFGCIFDSTSHNNIRFSLKNNRSVWSSSVSPMANISNAIVDSSYFNAPYAFAFKPRASIDTHVSLDSISWTLSTDGSTNATSFINKKSFPIPDSNVSYRIRVRAENFSNMYTYNGKISKIERTLGATSVVIDSVEPHGLAVGDNIVFYNVLNTTAFPNVTVPMRVSVVNSPSRFTYQQSTASTSSSISNGGVFFKVHGSNGSVPDISPNAISSYICTDGVLKLTSSTSFSGISVGDYFFLLGSSNSQLENIPCKVVSVSGANCSLEGLERLIDFSSVTENLTLLRALEYRTHSIRVTDYARNLVEVSGGWNQSDPSGSVPVSVTSPVSVSSIVDPIIVSSISNTTSQGTQLLTSIPANTNNISSTVDCGFNRNLCVASLLINSASSIALEQSLDNKIFFETSRLVATAVPSSVFQYSMITKSGTTCTVVTTRPHPFSVGMTLTVGTTANLVVSSVPSSNTFTVSSSTLPAASTLGNITMNGLFSAIISSPVVGRYVRARIYNTTTTTASFCLINIGATS